MKRGDSGVGPLNRGQVAPKQLTHDLLTLETQSVGHDGVKCHSCGSRRTKSDRFCGVCGTALQGRAIRTRATIAYLLSVLTIALGLAFFAFGLVSLIQPGPAAIKRSLPDWMTESGRGAIKWGFFGLFWCFIWGWMRFIVRIGERLWVRGAGEHIIDGRPLVLYLRPFVYDDKMRFGLFGAPQPSFEELLVEVLSSLGPVVAIGQPGEQLPPLGARRYYPTSADWQAVVLKRMQSAIAVVLRAGVTPGLQWEAEVVVRHVHPHRVLLAIGYMSDEQYGAFIHEVRHAFPRGLPSERGRALWLAFESDWSPWPLALPKRKRILGQRSHSRSGIKESLRPFSARLAHELAPEDATLRATYEWSLKKAKE